MIHLAYTPIADPTVMAVKMRTLAEKMVQKLSQFRSKVCLPHWWFESVALTAHRMRGLASPFQFTWNSLQRDASWIRERSFGVRSQGHHAQKAVHHPQIHRNTVCQNQQIDCKARVQKQNPNQCTHNTPRLIVQVKPNPVALGSPYTPRKRLVIVRIDVIFSPVPYFGFGSRVVVIII